MVGKTQKLSEVVLATITACPVSELSTTDNANISMQG
jgi:hypothetical protein